LVDIFAVPNTNNRSAGLIGVVIRCRALISAISDSVGSRACRSSTISLASQNDNAATMPRASRIAYSHFIAVDCDGSGQ
jgi:hypothetical protein